MRIAVTFIVCIAFSSCNPNWENEVVEEVLKMEEIYAEFQRTGDFEKQGSLHSDDYSYIDVSGKKVTKEALDFRRDDDLMTSIGLRTTEQDIIPLSPSLAISRGRQEGLSIYYGGIPRIEPTRYMAVWRKESEGWKILVDQVTPIINREISRPVIGKPENFHEFEGRFQLKTSHSLNVELKFVRDTLRLIIPKTLEEGIKFLPTYNNTYFSKERPWELKFHTTDSITLNSWGQISNGIRIE